MTSTELIDEVYTELRTRASRLVRNHTGSVAPSSLVHEVLIRLWNVDSNRWRSKSHFRAVAAKAMRQVLIDRARARGALKRGGDLQRVELPDLPSESNTVNIIALEHCIARLQSERPRCAQVVELRLLGGMEVVEVADWLKISASTVKREWRVGRAWLIAELEL